MEHSRRRRTEWMSKRSSVGFFIEPMPEAGGYTDLVYGTCGVVCDWVGFFLGRLFLVRVTNFFGVIYEFPYWGVGLLPLSP